MALHDEAHAALACPIVAPSLATLHAAAAAAPVAWAALPPPSDLSFRSDCDTSALPEHAQDTEQGETTPHTPVFKFRRCRRARESVGKRRRDDGQYPLRRWLAASKTAAVPALNFTPNTSASLRHVCHMCWCICAWLSAPSGGVRPVRSG